MTGVAGALEDVATEAWRINLVIGQDLRVGVLRIAVIDQPTDIVRHGADRAQREIGIRAAISLDGPLGHLRLEAIQLSDGRANGDAVTPWQHRGCAVAAVNDVDGVGGAVLKVDGVDDGQRVAAGTGHSAGELTVALQSCE